MSSVSRLVIDQQYAAIGIKITPAQMQITTHRRQMKVQNEVPEMSFDQETPTFELNWAKVFSEIGNKLPKEFSQNNYASAKSKTMNAITSIVNEGEQLSRTNQKGNRVASIARSKSLSTAHKEINIGLSPQNPPDVTWDKGYINIGWSNHNFKIEWEGEYMPELVIDPRHSVEVFLRNHPKITITVNEYNTADLSSSRFIDEAL